MEANKLMTGDWVLIKRTPSCEYPYKICSINNYSILGEDYADWIEVEAGEEINLEDIKPIPLTSEILEKNGFSLDVKGTNHPLYKGTKIKEYIISMPPNNHKEHLIWNGECYIMFDYPKVEINYVHELQHALRLCGITHEIVL